MKKPKPNNGMRPEYDFAAMRGGVRGKYVNRYREGTNIELLEPDIAEAFPNDRAVNQALRGILNAPGEIASANWRTRAYGHPASVGRVPGAVNISLLRCSSHTFRLCFTGQKHRKHGSM